MAKKILIIDDDSTTRRMLTHCLTAAQYAVTCASDGREGLTRICEEKPDLIILDVLMPQMDGYTFLRTLRRDELNAVIPVIVLTAKDRMQDLFGFEGIGKEDYLIKPYKPEELLAKINSKLSI